MQYRVIAMIAIPLMAVVALGAPPVVQAAVQPEKPCFSCESGCSTLNPNGGLGFGTSVCIQLWDENGTRCSLAGEFCIVGVISSIAADGTRYLAEVLQGEGQIVNCDGTLLTHAPGEDAPINPVIGV
ncbi:MAG: hypothetical protein U0974_07315 [Gemmatimonadales bacterium]|nr:hypothetical protein [Gemmatimonadales bacterium]MDZ4389522.1 hypothetical protein [Gemmatimonadales bacterium]